MPSSKVTTRDDVAVDSFRAVDPAVSFVPPRRKMAVPFSAVTETLRLVVVSIPHRVRSCVAGRSSVEFVRLASSWFGWLPVERFWTIAVVTRWDWETSSALTPAASGLVKPSNPASTAERVMRNRLMPTA